MSEFPRPVPLDQIGDEPSSLTFEADAGERAALAGRFGWLSIDALRVAARVHRVAGGVEARGTVDAQVTQACVVTGEPVAETVAEPFALRFSDAPPFAGADEVELGEGELDILPIDGGAIDLGEAAAQTLALAVDPFPKAPDADARLREAGVLSEEEAKRAASPFAALKALADKA